MSHAAKDLLTDDQFRTGCGAICLPLSFLLELHDRETNRKSMPGMRDSAIFFRLWDLFNCLTDHRFRERLSSEQEQAARAFESDFARLQWRPIASHPYISELRDDDLSALRIPGRALYESLKAFT